MADVSIRFRADSRDAQRQMQQLQQEVKGLQRGLGQTGRSADTAGDQVEQMGQQSGRAAREVDKLGREIFETREEAQRLGGVYRDLNGRLRESNGRFVSTGRGLGRLTEGLGGASGGANVLTRNLGGLSTVLGGIGIAVAANEVAQFTANSVRAAVQVESFTNAFSALGLGAAGASSFIRELQELSRLPGVEFSQAAQGAVRLRVIGIEGERATGLIRELGNALALTGDTDLSGAIRAITQIIQLQRVNQEEINQLVERSGAAAAALNEIFSTTRAESIQAQLEASGRSVQDFVDLLTEGLSRQARVAVDSTQNSLVNLRNSVFCFNRQSDKS